MSRNTLARTLLLLVASTFACAPARPEGAATNASALTTSPDAALAGAIDAYVDAVLASDVAAVRKALSPSAQSFLESRFAKRTWDDFVAAERKKLEVTLGAAAVTRGFSLARATPADVTTWVVEGSLDGKALTKALKVEAVEGGYTFAGPAGGSSEMLDSTSYRIDNNTSSGHLMSCTGFGATSVPANQTTYKSCDNYCGFWEGSQFWDGATYIGACDYNTWGADVVINGSLAQCVGSC
jgi:hypothetical protein